MKVKLWRRAFAASMSAVMLLGLTACGGSNSTESSDGIPKSSFSFVLAITKHLRCLPQCPVPKSMMTTML